MNAIFLGLFLASLYQMLVPDNYSRYECYAAGFIAGSSVWFMVGGELGLYIGLTIFAIKSVSSAIRTAINIYLGVDVGSQQYYKIFIVETLALPTILVFVYHKII
jgi:small basic protein